MRNTFPTGPQIASSLDSNSCLFFSCMKEACICKQLLSLQREIQEIRKLTELEKNIQQKTETEAIPPAIYQVIQALLYHCSFPTDPTLSDELHSSQATPTCSDEYFPTQDHPIPHHHIPPSISWMAWAFITCSQTIQHFSAALMLPSKLLSKGGHHYNAEILQKYINWKDRIEHVLQNVEPECSMHTM